MAHTVAKLVRDKIPEIIRQDGKIPIIKVISGKTLADALSAKLLEEHQEYLSATDEKAKLEELADLLEVIYGLANHIGATKEDLLKICDQKRSARGGFSDGVYWEGNE